MKHFYRMQLDGPLNPFGTTGGINITLYRKTLHNAVIPDLYADSFGKKPWKLDWDNFAEFDPDGIFLASDGSTLVGFVISFKRNNFGYISIVAVRPNWRKLGIASALIKAAIDRFHSLQMKTVQIDVDTNRASAVALYKKLGFSIVEVKKEP